MANRKPPQYIPGLGRGAVGFTTRSDVGPAAPSASSSSAISGSNNNESYNGSRSAEVRAALKQQNQQHGGIFGTAPVDYVPGAGRGAGRLSRGDDDDGGPVGAFDSFGGYVGSSAAAANTNNTSNNNNNNNTSIDGQFDEDDDDADRIWASIDERMNTKRNRRNNTANNNNKRKLDDTDDNMTTTNDDDDNNNARMSTIGVQFRELKEKLAEVSEEQWAAIPEVGDHSLKYKQNRRQQDTITPLTDSLLEQRRKLNQKQNNTISNDHDDNNNDDNNDMISGSTTTTNNMSGLSAARNTVLGMSLDRMQDSTNQSSTTTTTNVNASGYLDSLSNTDRNIAMNGSSAEIGDINKARLLLKSVRETNPTHAPGWIASARVEEAAGKLLQARKIIQDACDSCPNNVDVWLEAARLHPHNIGKSILATAARRIPNAVSIFMKAIDMENTISAKRSVVRKGLESNPTSEVLWKTAIELEDDCDTARVLLSVAVEKIPHSVDMWLALARLESYTTAQNVLSKARKVIQNDRSIWIAAAKLEEAQLSKIISNESNNGNSSDTTMLEIGSTSTSILNKDNGSVSAIEVSKRSNDNDEIMKRINVIVERAVTSLRKNDVKICREEWINEAENAELSSSPLTCAAIIRQTIGIDIDLDDRQKTWIDDTKKAIERGRVVTARAIVEHSLAIFPTKRSFWMLAVDLEKKHGTSVALDEVFDAASKRLPRLEIFWLLRAKEHWINGNIDEARVILTNAFAANPESEAVWLAAAKLEWENLEFERARVLLHRARERAPTDRVYMKSALLEREQCNVGDALQLLEEGIALYPKFAKLYMMGGQICSTDLPKQKSSLDRARKFYQRGLENCSDNAILWILASQLEERSSTFLPETKQVSAEQPSINAIPVAAGTGAAKARSLLEVARLNIPNNAQLWLASIRLELRVGTLKLAETILAKALQECPSSGILLAERIYIAPRIEKKSKSADAIKRCPDDPLVIAAVATLFASERKLDKARKWFDRAITLDPDIGDSWVRYYSFEIEYGDDNVRKNIIDRCTVANPVHGEIWTTITKDMKNRRKSISECLDIAAKYLIENKK